MKVGDAVDHAVGVMVLAAPGDEVQTGQPLLEFHHRDGRGLEAAMALCRGAVTIGDAPPATRDKVLDEVR
jgi:thymidine phosphorylase